MGRQDFPGQAAAQRALDNACDCCDHGKREPSPHDDLYFDGWTPGGKRQRVMTLAQWNAEQAERRA